MIKAGIGKLIQAKIRKIFFPVRSFIFEKTVLSRQFCTGNEFAFNGKNILIIAPHADDEYVGCCEFIRQYRKNNTIHVFLCSFLGSNSNKENRITRENEFAESCRRFGLEYTIAGQKDILEKLNKCIDKIRPEFIFLPSVIDPHYEHRETNYILRDALDNTGSEVSIVWYPVSMPIFPSFVNYVQPYSSQEKWSRFSEVYPSQRKMHLKRFSAEEKFIGHMVAAPAAESFVMLPADKWKCALSRVNETIAACLDEIKNNHREDHLRHVYETSGNLYQKILAGKNQDRSKKNELRQINKC